MLAVRGMREKRRYGGGGSESASAEAKPRCDERVCVCERDVD